MHLEFDVAEAWTSTETSKPNQVVSIPPIVPSETVTTVPITKDNE